MTEQTPASPRAGDAALADLLEGLDAIVWEADPALGRYTYVSRGAEALLGWPPEAWTDGDAFRTGFAVHPDDRARVAECRAGPHPAGRCDELEYRAVAADGRTVWLRDLARAVEEGGGTRLRGVAVDVTRRKEAEEALRAREAQLAEAQRLARLGSWEWDAAAGRAEWSEEMYRLFGVEPGGIELTMDGYLERVFPADRERVRESVERALAEGGEYSLEHRIVRPDGEVRWLAAAGRVLSRQPPRLAGTVLDVTERSQAEDRERELLRAWAARVEAEEAEQRSAFLAEAGTLLAASLDYEATLRSLAALAVPRLADWCAVDVLDEDGAIRRLAVVHPDPAKERLARELNERYPVDPDAPAGVPRVLRTGEPELVPEIPPSLLEASARDAEHLRIVRELELRSYMVVPLVARGRTLGAISFVAAESGRRYDAGDLAFARQLADRAAQAVDNARLYRDAERAREQTQRILESITDAFFALDREWRFTYLNDEAEHLLFRPRGALLGRSVWEEFPEAVGSEFWEQYHRAAAEGRTVQFQAFYPPLDAWFEVRAYPSSEGLSVYFRNVNEERRAQEALRRSEENYRFMTDAIPQLVWITRPDGYHEYYNRRWFEYTGLDLEATRGAGWNEVLHPDDRERAWARWKHSLDTGEPYSIEYRFRRHDGAFRWFLGQALAQRDEAEAIVGWFGTCTDIHDQREAAAERDRLIAALEASNRELDQFAYVASHDLKAPLRGIANLSQWIEEDLGAGVPAETREHLELMRGRVHRMEGLIDGVLQYSRAGRVREKPEPVEVGALLDEVLDLLAPPEGVLVEVGLMPTLVAERLPLQQVFMNLVGNALKYTRRPDARVEVAAERRGPFWEFAVRDNGPGIAPEYHDRIFGIFQTLQARDKVEGTGIGLSLVRKLVESRGGRVRVESAEGQGSVFRFLWPAETEADAGA